jgi:NTP pyrophosphatase (non-canonical NTP hydrolase)
MKTMSEIQIEQRAWSERNFGTHPSWHPLLGMQEEAGELAHAYLKRAQGIRGTKEQHDAAIKDAIGDIMIYLMDFCSCLGVQLVDEWFERATLFDSMSHRPLIAIQANVGVFSRNWLLGLTDQTVVLQAFIARLQEFCSSESIDLKAVVNETWETVSKRDWKKNATDGT